MNKKGEGGGIYIVIIAALVVIFFILFLMRGEQTQEEKELSCDSPYSLSCDDVQRCYELCDEMPTMTWKLDCRDKLEFYLRKCFGGGVSG